MRRDNKPVRVVIDTNLCISMLIGKRTKQLRQLFDSPKYELAISEALIEEILRVTARPKLACYFNQDDVHDFVQFLRENALCFKVEKILPRCRDPKDDFLLELTVVANADILLSGDTDLTNMKRIRNCRIMTVSEFLKDDETMLMM